MELYDGSGKISLIDIPGFGDSEGRDQTFLDNLFTKLKEIASVDVFILVVRTGRLNKDLWEMLLIYKEFLGKEAWEHFIIVITEVDYDDHDEREREYEEYLYKEKREFSIEFSRVLKENASKIVPISLKPLRNG